MSRTYARDALVQHLLDYLPAELAARDAGRRARIVARRGPYEIPEGATLWVDDRELELRAGTLSAEELAADLVAEGLTAGADRDGRLVLGAEQAPRPDGPSRIELGQASVLEALGLQPGYALEVSISSPETRIYPYGPAAGQVDLTGPTICIPESTSRPERQRESEVYRLKLDIFFPGPQMEAEATLRAVGAYVDAIQSVIQRGDGRGHWMIGGASYDRVLGCVPAPWRTADHLWQLNDGRVPRPYGRAQPEFEIRVWSPPDLEE